MTPTTTTPRVTPGWSWRVPAARTLTHTAVPAPGGATLFVDTFDTSRVVAFHAPTPTALGALAATLGQDWLERTVRLLGPGGASDDDTLAPAPLPDTWQRIALVYAVRQWTRAPLDDSLLDVDELLAWSDAGVDAWADAVAASNAYRILNLVRHLHDGDLPAAVHDAVERAASLATGALPDGDERHQALIEAESTMAQATALDHGELTAAIAGWAVDLEPAAALTLSSGPEPAPARPGVQVVIDPLAVHTRVIAWAGPNQPAISTQVANGSVEVRITLGAGYDTDTSEALDLVVFAVEPRSGRVLGSAPVRPGGHTEVVAALDLGATADIALVGVCDATALDRVRTDPAGRSAALAEQHLLAAWSAARLAQAGRGSRELAHDTVDAAEVHILHAEDAHAFERALGRVRQLVHGEPWAGATAPLLAETLVGVDVDDPA